MPELNLNALKNIKRSKKKYRPYDLPVPELDKKEDKSAVVNKVENISTKRVDIQPVPQIVSEDQSAIESRLKKEYERKYRLKERELLKELSGKERKDDGIPSITTTDSNKTFIKKGNTYLENEFLFKIMKRLSSWDEPTVKLFMFFLEKTGYGSLKDVQVGRREIEANAVHGRYFKDTRDNLKSLNILSFREGYIGASRKKGTFYTIDTTNMLKN